MDYPKSVASVGLVNGRFVDEDPVTGTPGSLIPASWGNSVTQEILEVIKSSGAAADEGDNTQLRSAINALIQKRQNESLATQEDAESGSNSTKLMTPLRVFQAIGKKVLQATETITGAARVASQAEVNAGASDSVMVTPRKLRLGFMVRLGPSGYLVFPSWMGGLIIQWINGSASQTANNNNGELNLWPLAFPNALFLAVATHEGTSTATFLTWNAVSSVSRQVGINVRCPDYANVSISARIIGVGY
ncbi:MULTISPECIES: gp53-like domain-containing protein [Pseudomonas]|jgi:hypothetical protein|uniref:gp53-like domain-containing protein n=1 Tax=Pseudomonas TaxID=286 RepID=UPI001A9CBDA7|nr:MULTISPECIES: hypothetical protein [Pseudomonas]MDH1257697.1 hypothetical protein [Pseudomonas atacamensis]MDT6918577.1 hypothetical protein [Pseudomonas atacamensis]